MSQSLLHFSKMHGLGNDFMVIDATKQPLDLNKISFSQLANRHTGIGFDQLLLIEPSTQADFFCRILNADGSEAEQCGNGLRCVARYVTENGLHTKSTLKIETKAGIFPIKIHDMDNICVTLSPPEAEQPAIELQLESAAITLDTLSLGNPHAIMGVIATATAPVTTLGPEISTHPHFSCGTNVGFLEVITRDHTRLRTFERGSGETHACGSNACAAAIVGIRHGWLNNRVKVEFGLGHLFIEWQGEGKPIHMSGPATMVYKGEIAIR